MEFENKEKFDLQNSCNIFMNQYNNKTHGSTKYKPADIITESNKKIIDNVFRNLERIKYNKIDNNALEESTLCLLKNKC